MKGNLFITIVYIVLFLAFIFLITIFIYRITKFKYLIKNEHLVMKWYYFGLIPISYSIGLDRIDDACKINRKQFFRLLLQKLPIVWGKIPKEMVVIKLKKGLVRTIIISPSDIDQFLHELKSITTK